MSKNLLTTVLLCAVVALPTHSQCIPRDEKVEAQVEALLAKMSLSDKVGQMCELAIDKVVQNPMAGNASQTLAGGSLSADAVNDVFGKHRVGSILNVPFGTAQTPEKWCDIIRALNQASLEQCGLPQIYGVDQIHGASYTWGATLFPQEVGQGASFNPSIPRRIGEITAYETRACLIPWVYSPVMDISRSPLWPRVWESFGEDVLLNGIMASELTRGLQGDNPNSVGMQNVAACLKHYMAYGAAVSGKDRTPSSVTYRDMMEKYFQPFRMCCEAGALSLMVNSANNNGVPFHANRRLLTEWLKEGLDWDGMIVTDWADIDNIWRRDHVAATKKDAIALAINAGIDMTMDPYSTDFCDLLIELVNEGKVPMSRIDDAVRRILRLKIRVGLMDKETWDIPSKPSSKAKKNKRSPFKGDLEGLYPDFASDRFAQEATSMAEECMVLLKNEQQVLPLRKGTKLFVCGPNANSFRTMNGGWTYTWQGNTTDEIATKIGKYRTFLGALEARFGKENVTFSEMVRYDARNFNLDHKVQDGSQGDDALKDKIAAADVIVAFVGENSYTETPGNIDDLTLSPNQQDMVRSLAGYGKPIVLVLNEGRPRIVSEIEPLAKAVVHTFLPGNYGGDALANLLAGEANFSGRMPYTYPKHHGSFITYDCKPCEYVETMAGAYNYDANTTVQWTFGSGISYSEVKFANLRVETPKAAGKVKASKGFSPKSAAGTKYDGELRFTVDVTNQSDRKVKEPVLLFVSDLVASLTPDVKRLRAFTKVELDAHETKTVTLTVQPSDLAFVNEDMEWVLEPGQFRAAVGNQRVEFSLE
ncbi:MAG: glycoside hydrolase family 3 C-terminal domain-containing protein [Bacteroidaceae bacterium]|nr:glycoside hydrolase family 3 C-terminal domain-containing protein [Bacteroidaceae bacterium]